MFSNRRCRKSCGWFLRGCLLLSVLVLPRASEGQDVSKGADGAVAPADTWYVAGGCASRSGATRTRPVRGKLVPAWRWSPPKDRQIVGEPVVWDDLVCVDVMRKGAHYLYVLRLRDGTPACTELTFKTDRDLCPTIWNRVVIVRSDRNRLRAYRIGKRVATCVWTFACSESVSGPLLYGRDLFVCSETELFKFNLSSTQPAWRARGNYRGQLALYGEAIFALEYKNKGIDLVALSRDRGQTYSRVAAGQAPELPPVDCAGGVVVGDRSLLVCYPQPVSCSIGLSQTARTSGAVMLSAGGGDPGRLGSLSVLHLAAHPAAWTDQFLAYVDDSKEGLSLILGQAASGKQGLSAALMAGRQHHPDCARNAVSPSVAGSVAYVGSYGVDLRDLRIVWQHSKPTARRVIPARRTLLLMDAGSIEALREERGEDAPSKPEFLDTDSEEVQVKGASALLRDGTVLEGTLTLCNKEGNVKALQGGKKAQYGFREVLFLENQEGKPLLISDAAAAPDLVEFLVERTTVDLLRDLIKPALRASSVKSLGARARLALCNGIGGTYRSTPGSTPLLSISALIARRIGPGSRCQIATIRTRSGTRAGAPIRREKSRQSPGGYPRPLLDSSRGTPGHRPTPWDSSALVAVTVWELGSASLIRAERSCCSSDVR